MVPRISAPASTMACEFRLFQFGFATEIENDSTPFNASGRTASGISFMEPTTMVTGPASSVLVTSLGFLPKTFAKSDRRSSVAFCTGAGVCGASRITAEPSTRTALALAVARAAELLVLCAEPNAETRQNRTRTAFRMNGRNSAREKAQSLAFIRVLACSSLQHSRKQRISLALEQNVNALYPSC